MALGHHRATLEIFFKIATVMTRHKIHYIRHPIIITTSTSKRNYFASYRYPRS